MKFTDDYKYDAIVIGAGHAGIEAGLALAKNGCKTLMLSISLDNVGYLACNPSIGGTAKGHLVREIDALGGQMGITADKTLTQIRMLNISKGPAVQSLRAQVDKYKYHREMKHILEQQENLYLRQGEVKEIFLSSDGSRAAGVKTMYLTYFADVVIVAAGVYLDSQIIVGDCIEDKGPASFPRANYLSENLRSLGLTIRRFKTGTPARVAGKSIDLGRLEVQHGRGDIYTFSSSVKKVDYDRNVCYLGYTNLDTHRIIAENLGRTARSMGLLDGVGARYCPSVEDKIIRFPDKERHQFFLEPEGEGTDEMYVQGISTSLPADAQLSVYRSIEGFENVMIMRDAYAIEYDCIDPTQLYPTLMHKGIAGLFFAGQINGTSGYEEAAAQGIAAGINAVKYLKGEAPLVFTRDNSYIGVLIDDLVTKGTDEPYRMMTSRAEYRLFLRQDNAEFRLTETGRKAGLVSDKAYKRYKSKQRQLEKGRGLLAEILSPSEVGPLFAAAGEMLPAAGITIAGILKRGNITPELFSAYLNHFYGLDADVVSQLFIETRYEGYIKRQEGSRKEAGRVNSMPLPESIDYMNIKGLRFEAAEKLSKMRPMTVGQASRISGVSPADINALLINLRKNKNI